ncbi:MAG: acyl carrier protein [Planctomycetes bacterium]|nr:acyl carrier protein [Planctomycetota bacterium]
MKHAELRNIVANVLEIDPNNLDSDTDLNSIDTFDSVSVLTLIIAVDEQAGIKISPAEANALRYYRDIESLAERQGVKFVD